MEDADRRRLESKPECDLAEMWDMALGSEKLTCYHGSDGRIYECENHNTWYVIEHHDGDTS
jgi:hypothetical protein